MIDLFAKLFPATVAALSLVGLVAITLRLGKLSREVAVQRKKETDPLTSIVAGLKWEVTSLADRLALLESEARESTAAVAIRSGMNLSKRTQALRQYRLGQPPEEIARTLDMPKTEVNLLLKVHRIISQQ
jgi:hypothetical protein